MKSLSDTYPVWFCDIWGVLHDGVSPYGSTVDALQRHRRNSGTVILVSNSPRSTAGVTIQLDDIGIPRDAYDTAVTSGDVTRDLMRQTDGKLFHLGPSRDASLFEGLDIAQVPLERASAVICTGLFHDDRETPGDYVELLADMRQRGLTMICANPDKIVRKGKLLQYCAGSLAEAYERQGGKVLMAGKPFTPIYDLARRRAATIRDHDVPVHAILAIGDGPETDIKGAAAQGIACVFMTGLHDDDGDVAKADAAIRLAVPGANVVRTLASLDWA
jgi:HAD superfamily hydrolase (TIGR01459 family)